MSEVLQDTSAPALVRAIEENGFELFRLFRHWPRAEVHDGPNLLYTLTDIPFLVFNTVLNARLEPGTVDATIEAAIAGCEARNVPMLWMTGPSTRPANLGEHLVVHGFVHEGDRPQMSVGLLEMNVGFRAPPGLVIEQVRDTRTLARWCWVYNAGFGMPAFAEGAWLDMFSSTSLDPDAPRRHFIGRVNGAPVATSSLLLAGGVAGISAVTTLPGARRRGIGTAMTLASLIDARAAGYRIGVLGAAKMGAGLYHRIGFRECCKFGSYVWTGAANRRISESAIQRKTGRHEVHECHQFPVLISVNSGHSWLEVEARALLISLCASLPITNAPHSARVAQ